MKGQRQGTARRTARRTQQERRETTRAQLVDAAIQCLYELGFTGTTLAAVASRAKVTIGAVQHHFRTRNDLFATVMRDMAERLMANGSEPGPGGKSVLDRVQIACDQYWEIVSGRDYRAAMAILLGTARDRTVSAKINSVMAAAQANLDKRWMQLFADQGIPSSRISTVRHVALATLRGLALRQLQSGTADGWRREREVLVKMLHFALTAD